MKYSVSRSSYHLIAASISGALLILILNLSQLSIYFSLPVAAGVDMSSHAAVGKYYADHIFPALWGWTHMWLGGMPFPQFYPPFFFFSLALVYKILPFSYLTIFKYATLLLTLSVPALLAWITKRNVAKAPVIWFVALLSPFLLSTQYIHVFGVTLQDTFAIGLITQLFGFVLMLFWLGFFLNAQHSVRDYYLSIIFLTLVLLTNTHISFTALVIFITAFVIHSIPYGWRPTLAHKQHRIQFLSRSFLLGFLPLGLAACWYVPMLTHYVYLSGRPIFIGAGTLEGLIFFLKYWGFLIIFAMVGIVLVRKNKPLLILVLSAMVIFLLTISRIDLLLSHFPIHIYRSLVYFYLISTIFAAVVYGYGADLIRTRLVYKKSYSILWLFICSSPFVLGWVSNPFFSNYITDFSTWYEYNTVSTLTDYFKDKSGRINVESDGTDYVRDLNNLILEKNTADLTSDYTIYSESSLSTPFMVPFNMSLSSGNQIFMVDSFISGPQSMDYMRRQNASIQASRARLLGVDTILVSSPIMKNRFENQNVFHHEKDLGLWQLYTLKDVAMAEVLKYEPAVLFSELNLKKRDANNLDYIRFQEELFLKGNLDTLLVQAQDQKLDTSVDLDHFNMAIVSNYTYHDRKEAFKKLSVYSLNHPLILIENKNPLFADLKHFAQTETKSKIHIFSNHSSREVLWGIFDLLDSLKVPIATSGIIRSSIIDKTITITSEHPYSHEVPVLIKTSYFPDWKRIDGKPVYLATPSFMLTYITDKTSLVFTTPVEVPIGYIISLCSLCLMIYLLRRDISSQL
jgi:hypothetical protein